MKLDRNIKGNKGQGKYALLNLRAFREFQRKAQTDDVIAVGSALSLLDAVGILEWGSVGAADEFFVIKLRDTNAPGALHGYAKSCAGIDDEFSREVERLAARAGLNNEFCKPPD